MKTILQSTFVVVILLLYSCTGIKPGAIGGGKNLYETFFAGEEGTQYFIKTLSFEEDNNSKLNINIIFRHKNQINGNSTINLSIYGNTLIRSLDSVQITNGQNLICAKEISLLFTERDNKRYHTRFSTVIPLVEMKQLFNLPSWKIITYNNGNRIEYISTKQTQNKIAKINYKIFSIM